MNKSVLLIVETQTSTTTRTMPTTTTYLGRLLHVHKPNIRYQCYPLLAWVRHVGALTLHLCIFKWTLVSYSRTDTTYK